MKKNIKISSILLILFTLSSCVNIKTEVVHTNQNNIENDTLIKLFKKYREQKNLFDTINSNISKIEYDKKAIKLNNKALDLYSNVMGIPVSKNDSLLLDSAIVLLNKAIKIDKLYYIAYANKAMIISKFKKYNDAIKILDDIVKIKPSYAEGSLSQGFLFEKIADSINARKKYNEAIEAYLKRLNDPNEINKVNVQVDIAFALLFKEGKDKSIQIIDTLSSWYPNNDVIKMMKMTILSFDREEFIKKF